MLSLNFGTDLRIPVPDKLSEIVWFGALTLTNHKEAHNFFTSGNLAFFRSLDLPFFALELFDS